MGRMIVAIVITALLVGTVTLGGTRVLSQLQQNTQAAVAKDGGPEATATVTPVPVATATPVPTARPSQPLAAACPTFPAPSSDLDSMPKTKIELVPQNTWFHRVFNERLFHAPNWDGADSWFVTLALGSNSGGNWTSFRNPGQVIFRGTSTNISWCLGVLTTSKFKEQFLDGVSTSTPASINVRITPNSNVNVVTASGKTINQATSDAGDITIVLPDSGVTMIGVSYITAAPTHESHVWWGPHDRTAGINTIDAR